MYAKPWMGFAMDLAVLFAISFLCWSQRLSTEVVIAIMSGLVTGRATARGAAAGAMASMRPPLDPGAPPPPAVPPAARAPMITLVAIVLVLAGTAIPAIVWGRAHFPPALWMVLVVALGAGVLVGFEGFARYQRAHGRLS